MPAAWVMSPATWLRAFQSTMIGAPTFVFGIGALHKDAFFWIAAPRHRFLDTGESRYDGGCCKCLPEGKGHAFLIPLTLTLTHPLPLREGRGRGESMVRCWG